jgi:HD-like signal output (HDOD) protein
MIDPNVQRAVAAAECVEALPVTVTRAMEAIYSSRSGAREVAEIIGLDPALAGRILRLVNSPYYRTMSRPVVSLAEAVLRLGYQSVQSALLTAATTNLLHPPLVRYGLQRRDFWHHSVAAAISARALASLTRFSGAEESYVAGLLHDVGKVGLDRQQASGMTNVRNMVREQGMSYPEAERAEFGFDHAYIGQLVAAKWGLSLATQMAIGSHHGSTTDPDHLTATVSVGDSMAWLIGFAGAADENQHPIDPAALDRLNLNLAAIEGLVKQTTPQIQDALSALQIEPATSRR